MVVLICIFYLHRYIFMASMTKHHDHIAVQFMWVYILNSLIYELSFVNKLIICEHFE